MSDDNPTLPELIDAATHAYMVGRRDALQLVSYLVRQKDFDPNIVRDLANKATADLMPDDAD